MAAVVGGLGAVDIGLRAVPDVLGLGESIVIPALVGVTAQYAVSSPVAATLVGLVMLALPVAYLTPALFPRPFLTSSRNLVVRGFVGLSALAVTLYAREAILVALTGEPTWIPVTPSVRSAVRVLGGIALGLVVLLAVPWDRFGTDPDRGSVVGEPGRRSDDTPTRLEPGDEADSDTDGESTPDPWQWSIEELDPPLGLLVTGVLVIVGVGVVLATLSLLSPVPELIAIVGGLYVAVAPETVRTSDVTEPLVLAVRSVWNGVLGTTVFVYTVVILYVLTIPGAEGIVSVYRRVGLLGGVAYTAAGLVPMVYSIKYIERSYRSVLTNGAVRVPVGAMVPPGVLSGLQIGVERAGAGDGVVAVVDAWTTPVWTVAVVGAFVTLLIAFLPGGSLLSPLTGHAESDDAEPGFSAPTVAIPVGVAGLILGQGLTRDLVAYHLTSTVTAVGLLLRVAGAVLVAAIAAGALLVGVYATVFVLSLLFYGLSAVTPAPLRRLLGA